MRLLIYVMIFSISRAYARQIDDNSVLRNVPSQWQQNQLKRHGPSSNFAAISRVKKATNENIINRSQGLVQGVRVLVTATVSVGGATDQSSCQCVPYHLCDTNNVGVEVNNPAKTGVGIINPRFSPACESPVDICCTIPQIIPTKPTPKPKQTTPSRCGYRNPKSLDSTLTKVSSTESQYGEFPWVVALMNGIDDSYIGVGVLIHPKVVLTAAHVVSAYNAEDLKIRAGEWDTQTVKELLEHQEKYIDNITIHSAFNGGNLINDIAILQLSEPVQLAEHINVACLAEQSEVFDNAKQCISNGWGKSQFGSNSSNSAILKKLEFDMVEPSRCNQLLRRTRLGSEYNLHSSFVCAGGVEGVDMCLGDGGGPLACPIGGDRYKVAGLVAWGIGCNQKDVPSVYASLPALRSWVDENMNTLGYGISSYTI